MSTLLNTKARSEKLKCVICQKAGEYHHLLTQKAYPELKDEPWNTCPLCRMHHSKFHAYGITKMAKDHFAIRVWLGVNGWKFCEVRKKYVPQTYVKEEKKEVQS